MIKNCTKLVLYEYKSYLGIKENIRHIVILGCPLFPKFKTEMQQLQIRYLLYHKNQKFQLGMIQTNAANTEDATLIQLFCARYARIKVVAKL